jgi:cytidylate kinase
MDNDEKLFEFMTKIYAELQNTRNEMQEGFKEIKLDVKGLKQGQISLENEVKKNAIKLEEIEKKVSTIAEIQLSHKQQNEMSFKILKRRVV